MSENKFEFGEELELDKIRTEVNLKKVITGLDKNLKNIVKIKK